MTTQLFNDEGEATLTLSGRLDTSVSSKVSNDIERLLATAGTIQHFTVDASHLEYISSSGLRILLMLAKRFKHYRITEVNPEVYDVLNMTGFTKMMTIERALRQLSVEGCEVIGIGGVGTVFRLDDDTIIKVFREGTTMEEVLKEITMSKEAFVMGMPTAISFDVVKVGSQYGLVYELLHAQTLSACLKQAPERIDELARKYADLFRQMHDIRVPANSCVPDALEHERNQVMHIRRYFPQEKIDLLLQLLDTRELGVELWKRAIDYYFEGLPADVVALRKEQIKALSCIRNFSWLALSDSFPEVVINECRALFDKRVTNNCGQLLEVCQTLKDWQ